MIQSSTPIDLPTVFQTKPGMWKLILNDIVARKGHNTRKTFVLHDGVRLTVSAFVQGLSDLTIQLIQNLREAASTRRAQHLSFSFPATKCSVLVSSLVCSLIRKVKCLLQKTRIFRSSLDSSPLLEGSPLHRDTKQRWVEGYLYRVLWWLPFLQLLRLLVSFLTFQSPKF